MNALEGCLRDFYLTKQFSIICFRFKTFYKLPIIYIYKKASCEKKSYSRLL